MIDAVSHATEVSNFFAVVEQKYVFFGHSISRWNALSLHCESRSCVTLKRLCQTRWSSRRDCLVGIRFRFVDILKVLTKLILTSKKKDEVATAASLKKNMECSDFVFILTMMTNILQTIDGV